MCRVQSWTCKPWVSNGSVKPSVRSTSTSCDKKNRREQDNNAGSAVTLPGEARSHRPVSEGINDNCGCGGGQRLKVIVDEEVRTTVIRACEKLQTTEG